MCSCIYDDRADSQSSDVRSTHDTAVARVAATLVSLHVASHTERLAAACVWALERLLASVRVTVNLQT